MRGDKTLAKLRAHKRVDAIDVEAGMAQYRASYFAYLKKGWSHGHGGAHCFGEDRLCDIANTLRQCVRCECEECRTPEPTNKRN